MRTAKWTILKKQKGTKGVVDFDYDALGNRIQKSFNGKTTYYVRDASGNILSTYESESVNAGPIATRNQKLVWANTYLYGAKRLGEYRADRILKGGPQGPGGGQAVSYNPDNLVRPRGRRQFELTSIRGDVWATVSDRKLQVDGDNDNLFDWNTAGDYYEADIATASEVYPFGMVKPGRMLSNRQYRFGFQGQEGDDEVKGDGNSWNYKYRMHDPRVGRFFAVDPLAKDYPYNSVYTFSENIVIKAVELEGMERKDIVLRNDKTSVNIVPKAKIDLLAEGNIGPLGFTRIYPGEIKEHQPNLPGILKNHFEKPASSLIDRVSKVGLKFVYNMVNEGKITITSFAAVQTLFGLNGPTDLEGILVTSGEERLEAGVNTILLLSPTKFLKRLNPTQKTVNASQYLSKYKGQNNLKGGLKGSVPDQIRKYNRNTEFANECN